MPNIYHLTYRIVDMLSKKISKMINNCDLILERSNSNVNECHGSFTYLVNDTKDKYQTKHVLKVFDLEKMINFTEFIVCD